MIKKIWAAILGDNRKPLVMLGRLAGVGLVLLLVGGTLVVGGAAGLAWTNTEAFCLGCHEMKSTVGVEYKDTIHDRNRTGVRAICPDCHVPRQPAALIARKFGASFELWGHFTGVIDTKEKFEKERPIMAEHVWTRMLKTDSIECRNCHTADKMDPEKQTEKAQARHAKAKAEGLTCIECHFGIAHAEPKGPGPKELKEKLKLGSAVK